MYKLIYVLLIPVLLFGCSQKTENNRGYIVQSGDATPDFEIQFTDSSTARLSDFHGRVIMLQFTASWCKVCREEMPYIEKYIWQEFKDDGLVLIGIDRDEPLETVVKFAEQMQISYPLALDPGAEIFQLFALEKAGVTRNIIIDKNGNIVYLTRLFDKDEFYEMRDVIEKLL